jgi:hypothetical protein
MKMSVRAGTRQAQLYAALMAKEPPVAPPQDTTAATIKALTDKINRLESGTNGGTGRGQYRKAGGQNFPANGKYGTRITRRWDNDNYYWTCGYDIKHTSETCKYIKDTVNHKKRSNSNQHNEWIQSQPPSQSMKSLEE